jgi:hypothetical protein
VRSVVSLGYFTVQLRRPAEGWSRLEATSAAARQVSEQMQRQGKPVRFLRSIFVPEYDVCFHLYEAGSIEQVQAASRAAAAAGAAEPGTATAVQCGVTGTDPTHAGSRAAR